jgi:hypothetical protein
VQRTSLMLLRREGVLLKAIEAGFLTLGSSYLPTPSQRLTRQWQMRLAFVPDYSGASVRELHPLPACFTSIAITNRIPGQNISPAAADVKAILRATLCNSWHGETGRGSIRWVVVAGDWEAGARGSQARSCGLSPAIV